MLRVGLKECLRIQVAAGESLKKAGQSRTRAAQLKRLPAADSVILYIDFDQLRRAGFLKLLNAPKGAEEEEYRKFAERIHLDWRQDLHSAMLAFAPSGKYMLVK